MQSVRKRLTQAPTICAVLNASIALLIARIPDSKLQVQAFVEELRETHDTTIVLTTHDLDEAEKLCDRITVLNDGRVVAEDTPDGLIAEVATRLGRAATLEDVFMTLTGRSLDDDVDDADGEPRELTGGTTR